MSTDEYIRIGLASVIAIVLYALGFQTGAGAIVLAIAVVLLGWTL